MLKKSSLIVLVLSVVMALAACSSSKDKAASSSSGKSKTVEATIENASYILSGEDDGVSEDKKTGLLSVKLKVKNLAKSDIRVYGGINLYDGDNQIEPKIASNGEIDLHPDDDLGRIGAGKMKEMTVLFEVERGKEYELGIKPSSTEGETKEAKLKLDTKKYADTYDQLQDPAKALKAYIETLYLDKDNADYEKYVTADKSAVQDEAKKQFKDSLSTFFENIPDSKIDKYYQSFKSASAEKDKIETETKANANGKAIVKLEYSALDIEGLTDLVTDYEREYEDKRGDLDYDKEKQYALSKFDTMVNKLQVKSGRRDAEIKMVKKDGKWTVDTSDDYNTEKIEQTFAKGMVY